MELDNTKTMSLAMCTSHTKFICTSVRYHLTFTAQDANLEDLTVLTYVPFGDATRRVEGYNTFT